MNITRKGTHKNIAVVQNDSLIITDLQSALDFAMTIRYDTGASNLVIPKECVTKDFFALSTKLAGDILQKYVNYGIKLAIIGDFSGYTSKALHDFIYESNKGKDFFFVPDVEEAIKKMESSME